MTAPSRPLHGHETRRTSPSWERRPIRKIVAFGSFGRGLHADFSPSLETIRKVSHGLGLSVTELFVSLEMCPGDELDELVALVAGCPPRVIRLIIRLARVVIDGKPGR